MTRTKYNQKTPLENVCLQTMRVIHLKKKNICLLISLTVSIFFIAHKYKLSSSVVDDETTKAKVLYPKCNKYLKPFIKPTGPPAQYGRPIDILGPPGSGVEWLRFIIEQLTGLHTGSIDVNHPELFAAEGKTEEVLAVMSYSAFNNIPGSRAAILIYRNLYDTVRTHFSEKMGTGVLLEAPLQAYYGNSWKLFAVEEGRQWAASYASYIKARQPVMVIMYDELEDKRLIQTQLLRLSNFVRVPVRHSALQCIVQNAHQFPLKPQPLKTTFQPFQLLSVEDMTALKQIDNRTLASIDKVRSLFRPNV